MAKHLHLASIALALMAAQPATPHILAESLPVKKGATPVELRPDRTFRTTELVAELLDWIVASTDYAPALPPPEIVFCETGDCIPYETGTVIVGETLNGAYDRYNARIVLIRPWDVTDTRDQSILLHELVHHVQLGNRDFDCLAATELEAYRLQDAYLSQHGIASGFDWSQINLLSSCPPAAHSR